MGRSSRFLVCVFWVLIFPEHFTVFHEGEAAHAVKRFTGLYTGPYFDPTTTTNITTQLGTHAYIPCKIKQLGNKSVSWIRRRDAHILTVDRYTFIADDRFQAFFVEATDTWTLQVKYVQARDAGQYECQVSTEPKMSHFITLNVVVPKIEIEGESDIYVKRGSTVQLKCVITQSLEEPAYIFWYHDGERVLKYDQRAIDIRMTRKGTDTTISTITIFRTRPSDSGNYTCSPSNLDSASVYLHVLNGWCSSQVCLKGKTALVTGANTGIGFETALDLAKRGARVILACRDQRKGALACDTIKEKTHNEDVVFKHVDLGSLKSVRQFVHDINSTEERLDILVNNAGASGLGDHFTEDGLQILMQVNYFAPFLLTVLLLDFLKNSPSNSRIINVSSEVAKYTTLDLKALNTFEGDWRNYTKSKLCNVLFTIELASRLKDTNVTAYSLHPGVVKTEFLRRMPVVMRNISNFFFNIFFKTAVEGAQTSIYLAVEDGIEPLSGEHFHDCHLVKRYASASDVGLAKKLWAETEKIISACNK